MVLAFVGVVAATGVVLAGEATVASSRIEVIQAMLDGGKYDEAAGAAKGMLHGIRDDQTRTDAMRILAVALRKKGEWKAAAKAYADLKDRFDKSLPDYVLSEATAEVLAASPKGVYPPLAAKSGTTDPALEPAATLASDTVLASALAMVGDGRAAKANARLAEIRKSRSPKEIVKILEEMLRGFQQARVLNAALSPDLDRNAAQSAGAALEAVDNDVFALLRQKVEDMRTVAVERHTIDNTQKDKVTEIQEMSRQAGQAEDTFRALLNGVAKGWPEARALDVASRRRMVAYNQLTRRCQSILLIGIRGGRRR
ncbi:MAG: hypothetical protein IMZ55_17125 [Acidobacteria bacterium]|nr:hypothetical protein [Acidobacteriota bacterium]